MCLIGAQADTSARRTNNAENYQTIVKKKHFFVIKKTKTATNKRVHLWVFAIWPNHGNEHMKRMKNKENPHNNSMSIDLLQISTKNNVELRANKNTFQIKCTINANTILLYEKLANALNYYINWRYDWNAFVRTAVSSFE